MPRVSFRTISRFGTIAMALILTTMAVLAIGTLIWSRDETRQLKTTIQVSDAYNQTALNAALSAVYSTNFAETGQSEDLDLYQKTLIQTFAFESLIKEIGSDADRAYLASIEARYAADILKATQALQAIANGQAPAQGEFERSTLTQVTSDLTEPAAEKRQGAIDNLNTFQSRLEGLSLITAVVFLLGLPIVFGSYILTKRYERKEAIHELEMESLKQAALTDALTGLANHRAFQDDLRLEVARAARSEHPICIAMLDVDNFKEINDSSGHAHGDTVLATLAGFMSHLRTGDRAYRVGGDEFALIMPETNSDQAGEALERLRDVVEKSLPQTTISIGYTATDKMYISDALRDHADMALYEAKRRGKNQVVPFVPALASGVELSAVRMEAIRRVLEKGDMEMWFQPIYRLASHELYAFEALMRMPNEPGIEGPQEAFEIAQVMGRSRELDMMCVTKALDAAGDLPDSAMLFLNLDPGTLSNSRFSAEQLSEIVARHNLEPSRIVFEITERTIAPLERVKAQVEMLRSKGFGVALDDVGAGNAGLELMRLLKFDYVKIDRSVIVDAMHGGQGRAIILAIVAFARETGSFMIAEGIEDVATLEGIELDEESLRAFWVQGVQGFLLGEPRPSIRSFLGPDQGPQTAAA